MKYLYKFFALCDSFFETNFLSASILSILNSFLNCLFFVSKFYALSTHSYTGWSKIVKKIFYNNLGVMQISRILS